LNTELQVEAKTVNYGNGFLEKSCEEFQTNKSRKWSDLGKWRYDKILQILANIMLSGVET
jgi:hypothetical protein